MQTPNLADLAKKVDAYIEVRERRRQMERDAEKLKEKEEAPLRAAILEALKTSGAGAVGGTRYQASLTIKKSPQVADWGMFYQYIKDNDAFELLQKRLSGPAVKERWEAKVEIPGVVAVDVDDLSITKL